MIFKIGRYPVHSGGVGVARSLGRLGVPTFAVVEDLLTPLARSRYCTHAFRWRTTGMEDPSDLVAGLVEISTCIGTRSVAIATDDEAAILLAEHSQELSPYYSIPAISNDLPRKLANKHELSVMCRQHEVPAPWTVLASSRDEAAAWADRLSYPVVAKNAEPWTRIHSPIVAGTRQVHSRDELLELANSSNQGFSLLLQEYIPPRQEQDWFVHLYCDANSNARALFTGMKLRSWPPHAGATACGYSIWNPELAELAERFCKEIGYQGIGDMDWRFDYRDGQYKLLDFNPRVGNQFALFQTDAGVDVIRALHLDLAGVAFPSGMQIGNRKITVEHFDLPARLVYRKIGYATCPSGIEEASSTILAWAAADDLVPALVVWPRLFPLVTGKLTHQFRSYLSFSKALGRRLRASLARHGTVVDHHSSRSE